MKIFLIGFMGSGKSYTGKHLATHLNYTFVDLDEEIVSGEGKSIPEIFIHGEEYFRRIEKEYLRKTEHIDHAIIATGGGAPCFHGNMGWMNEHGVTVFLDTHPEILVNRLSKKIHKRPVLKAKVGKELMDLVSDLLNSRMEYYNQAQLACEVKEDGKEAWEVLLHHLKFYKI